MRTAAASWVTMVLGVAASFGLEVDATLAELGLDRADLANPDARIPLSISDALVVRVARRIEPHGGVWHVAQRSGQPLVRDCLFFLCMNAPNLRSYFELLQRYQRLNSDGAQLDLVHEADAVTCRIDVTDAAARPRAACELAHAGWVIAAVRRARVASAGAFVPRVVCVGAPAPTRLDGIESVLGVMPTFGAAHSSVCFDAHMLDAPFPAADRILFGAVQQRAEALLAALPPVDDLRAQVRAAVRVDLTRGHAEPSLARVARRLGSAERSLQRRLQIEGASFRSLVDDARRELAVPLVADDALSIAEVAERVGFESTSAFAKRFRRWTGRTPSEHRSATASTRAAQTKSGALA